MKRGPGSFVRNVKRDKDGKIIKDNGIEENLKDPVMKSRKKIRDQEVNKNEEVKTDVGQ